MSKLLLFIALLPLTGCLGGEQGAETIDAEQSIIGRYGPKDWQSGAQAQFCAYANGVWTCATTGGVSPGACAGATFLGGAFELGSDNTIISNSFGDATYSVSGIRMSWFPSGTAFDVHELIDGDYVLDFQPGCAMLYEKE